MKCVKSIVLISLSTLYLVGCSSPQPRSGGWSLNMRGMADSYEKLLPYIYDSKRFNDPNNRKYISLHLKNLNQNASSLDRHTAKGLSGNDPLFIVGLKGLTNQIEKASESYFVESNEYSRKLLRSSVNYCNSCHTRTAIGPTFIKWDQFEDITKKMPAMDHANVLIATRQFPKAVKVLKASLNDKKSTTSDKDRTLKKILAVQLKNLKDPKAASDLLNSISPTKFSKKLRTNFNAWKAYLKLWEKGTLTQSPRSLIKSGNPVGEHYVQTLYNSEILHTGLSSERKRLYRAKTYHALGQIYAKYPELASWNLPQTYYETCIYQDPGTKQALRCYYDLEAWLKNQTGSKQQILSRVDKANLKKLKSVASQKPKDTSGAGAGFGFDGL